MLQQPRPAPDADRRAECFLPPSTPYPRCVMPEKRSGVATSEVAKCAAACRLQPHESAYLDLFARVHTLEVHFLEGGHTQLDVQCVSPSF